MKKIVLISGILISIATTSQAQPSVGCNDRSMRLQSEQIKQDFKKQGLTVYRDAMLGMQSKEPYHIAVDLEKGKLYQMVFIGNKAATRMDFGLFEQKDQIIDVKSALNPAEYNTIIYSFVPAKSDRYLVVLTQKMKNKSMCGSFTIMQKDNTTPQ